MAGRSMKLTEEDQAKIRAHLEDIKRSDFPGLSAWAEKALQAFNLRCSLRVIEGGKDKADAA
jgi:hypothetical protein